MAPKVNIGGPQKREYSRSHVLPRFVMEDPPAGMRAITASTFARIPQPAHETPDVVAALDSRGLSMMRCPAITGCGLDTPGDGYVRFSGAGHALRCHI